MSSAQALNAELIRLEGDAPVLASDDERAKRKQQSEAAAALQKDDGRQETVTALPADVGLNERVRRTVGESVEKDRGAAIALSHTCLDWTLLRFDMHPCTLFHLTAFTPDLTLLA